MAAGTRILMRVGDVYPSLNDCLPSELHTTRTARGLRRYTNLRSGSLFYNLNRLLASSPTSRSSHCSVLSASSLVVRCQPSSMTTQRGRTPPSCSVDNPSSTPEHAAMAVDNIALRN